MRSTSHSRRRRSPTSSYTAAASSTSTLMRAGELDDVERAGHAVERGDAQRQQARHALGHVLRGCGRVPIRRHRHRGQPGDRHREERDRLGDADRLPALAQQPAGTALDQPPAREIQLRLRVDRDRRVERLDVAPQRVLVEDRARGFVRAHDVGCRRAGLLPQPERERDPGAVHEPVDERGRRDLTAQRVRADALEDSGRAPRSGSSARARAPRSASSGSSQLEHRLFELDLGVREQHGELGRRQSRDPRGAGRRAARRSAAARRRGSSAPTPPAPG